MTEYHSTSFPTFIGSNFAQWYQVVVQHAQSQCQILAPRYGLIGEILSDREWDIMLGQPGSPRPNVNPPPELPANATAAIIAQHKSHLDHYNAWIDAVFRLKQDVLSSLDQNIRRAVSNPMAQHLVTLGTPEIMTFLQSRYNSSSLNKIASLKQLARQHIPGLSPTDWLNHTASLEHCFAQLQANGAPINEPDKIHDYLRPSIGAFPPIVAALDKYITDHPDIYTRSFQGCVDPVRLQLENITTTDAGYANFAASSMPPTVLNANANAAAATTTAPIDSRIDKLERSLEKLLLRDPRRRGNPRLHSDSHDTKPKHFCFHHGLGTHASKDCRFMQQRPSLFTDAQRNATHK